MPTLQKVVFGPEAITYLRDQLFQGDTLSRHLLDLSLESGRVYSYLPPTLDPEASRSFGLSVFLNTEVRMASDVRSKVEAIVADYVNQGGARIAVFEAFERRGDASPSLEEFPYFMHGDEVYFFMTSPNYDAETLRQVMRFGREYPSIWVLTSWLGDVSPIRHAAEVPSDVLTTLAQRAEHILVGAYDEEGYLIWSREGLL